MPQGNGYTVTYDGVPSTDLTGFMCHDVERGLIAARRTQAVSIGGMEGAHVFPEEPGLRTLEIDASVLVDAVNAPARRAAVREVAAWYNKPTPRKLIISDEPTLYEMAWPSEAPNVREWRQRGSFPLPFLCEPYSYEIDLQEVVVVMDAANDIIQVTNNGDVWTPFALEITAAGTSGTQSIAANGRTWARATSMAATNKVTFNTKAGVIHTGAIYDTDLQGLFEDGTLSMTTASGRPPILEPGVNNINVVMAQPGGTVKIIWRNRYS